jgi:hypothetical protein
MRSQTVFVHGHAHPDAAWIERRDEALEALRWVNAAGGS